MTQENEVSTREDSKDGGSKFDLIGTATEDDAVDPTKLEKPIFFFYGFCTCMIIVAVTSGLVYFFGSL